MAEAEDGKSKLRRARITAGMTQGDVRAKLAQVRKRYGKMPPKEASLKRMYTKWEGGGVLPTDWRDELCEVFELPPAALGFVEVAETTTPVALPEPFEVTRLDPAIVEMLDQQTDTYRMQDRLVGSALLPQTEAHVRHLEQLLRNALPGAQLPNAAVALAEAAALAGWQALNTGDTRKAWDLHDTAKAAARQGENPGVLAHVTAQQAYSLLDAQRPADAAELVAHARNTHDHTSVPPRLQAWLMAAHAEALSATGDTSGTLRLLDNAAEILPSGDRDPDLPYLMLNESNLARWRGNCLARLGDSEAIADLTAALEGLGEHSSRRAESNLRTDLAMALQQCGENKSAREHAQRAADLAGSTGSTRQRKRIAQLIEATAEH